MERTASLAVSASGVVPTLAGDLAVLALDAPCRVAVALTPAADGKVRDRVMMSKRAGPEIAREGAAGAGGNAGDRRCRRRRGEPAAALLTVIHRVVRLHLLRRDDLMDRGQSGGQWVQ